jgi:CO/xanthine dehydrogenase Mo-binding subunit
MRSFLDEPRTPGIGRGVSVSHCAGGMGASAARVELFDDARAILYTATSDQGSGAHAVLAEIVARSLCLPLDSVEIRVVDTAEQSLFDSGSSASRVTYVAGTAVHRAASQVADALRELAAELLGCGIEEVSLSDGLLRDTSAVSDSAAALPVREVCRRAIQSDAPLRGEARFADFQLMETPSFAALAAEVRVDRATGAFEVLRLYGAFDVGTVLNLSGMHGQIRGGMLQGLGFAVMEEVRRAGGRIETTSLGDYKLPTACDSPPFEYELITDLAGDGPFGAKSVGELASPLAPAAIANAIHDAVGVWLTELPLSAERIYTALEGDR